MISIILRSQGEESKSNIIRKRASSERELGVCSSVARQYSNELHANRLVERNLRTLQSTTNRLFIFSQRERERVVSREVVSRERRRERKTAVCPWTYLKDRLLSTSIL